jgi:hypothetical protein
VTKKEKIVKVVKDHPFIAMAATAAAGYFGGPPAQAALVKIWSMFAGG